MFTCAELECKFESAEDVMTALVSMALSILIF
jgi:hypothetical protein